MWKITKKEKDNIVWWNQVDGKPSLVVEVWKFNSSDNNSWRASVNNSWLAKDVSKSKAMSEAKEYMKKIN